MADKPVLNDIVGGARLNPTAINANNTLVEDAIGGCLGRGGTGEADNSMTGNLDMDENRIQNVGDAVAAGDAVSKAFVESNYGSASTAEAEHWANYPEDSLVPEGDLVDDYSALHFANKASASASAASVSASAASDSEVAAALSESNAATSESNAAASEAAIDTSISLSQEKMAFNNWSPVSVTSTLVVTDYCYSESLGYILTANGLLSKDGGDGWVQKTLSASGTSCSWAESLSLFCIAASNIQTSPDGTTWTDRFVPSYTLNSIVWSADLGLFCAVGDEAAGHIGYILTSPDGISWTVRTPPAATYNLSSVAWSSSLGLFCATSSSVGFLTSPDGITWTTRTYTGTIPKYVTWNQNIGLFCAVSSNGALQTSPDGITWTSRTNPYGTSSIIFNITSTESLFVAAGDRTETNGGYQFIISEDGVNWEKRLIPTSDHTNGALGAAYYIGYAGGRLFVSQNTNAAIMASLRT